MQNSLEASTVPEELDILRCLQFLINTKYTNTHIQTDTRLHSACINQLVNQSIDQSMDSIEE